MNFFSLPTEAQAEYILATSQELKIPVSMVEKDCWVSMVLNTLFTHPDFGPYLSFRGGTSLSKAYGLIERFSEDIDIALAPSFFPELNNICPSDADSPNQRNTRLRTMRKPYRGFMENNLLPYLKETLSSQNCPKVHLELEDLDKARDPFVLNVHYDSLFPTQSIKYVRSRVKIELSGRAQTEPSILTHVNSYVAACFPDTGAAFEVKTVSPSRTLWEKAFILHEENTRTPARPIKERLARHYYDLDCLITKGNVDLTLFADIAHARKLYHWQTWVDYDTITPYNLQLIPEGTQYLAWKQDFDHTCSMIFGSFDSFEEIVNRIAKAQKAWR